MTDAGRVRLAIEDTTATITLDRPDKRNALTLSMVDELYAAVLEVGGSDARVVVVRGAGEHAFCVGADITAFGGLAALDMWRDWVARGHRVFDALAALRQPTVAVLHAAALGGGLELALACDFRVVAESARLGLPEVGLGTLPGWGGTGRVTELVGPARAKEIVLARRLLDGAEAVGWGLATSCAPPAELDAAVTTLVDRLGQGAPVAVQLAKQVIDAAARGASTAALEALAGGLAATTEDLTEGTTAFRERRPPTFRGR